MWPGQLSETLFLKSSKGLKMAQWFRLLAALPKDLGSVPMLCIGKLTPATPASRDPVSSSGLHSDLHV